MRREDLTGKVFGIFKVIEFYDLGLKGMSRWRCKCLRCGAEHIHYGNNLKRKKCAYCRSCKREYLHNVLYIPNEFEIVGDTVIIKTNSNQNILIDVDDLERVLPYHWSINNKGYVQTYSALCKYKLLHRLILQAEDDTYIDHKDGNPLNNTKSNLRFCTPAENSYNKAMQPYNTSGVTGVSFDTNRNKWLASIGYNYKTIHLGRYDNFNDAVIARKLAEEKYFGEWSYDKSRTTQATVVDEDN